MTKFKKSHRKILKEVARTASSVSSNLDSNKGDLEALEVSTDTLRLLWKTSETLYELEKERLEK